MDINDPSENVPSYLRRMRPPVSVEKKPSHDLNDTDIPTFLRRSKQASSQGIRIEMRNAALKINESNDDLPQFLRPGKER